MGRQDPRAPSAGKLLGESMMSLRSVSLDDKYALSGGPVYLNGTQALVRLTLLERQSRAAQGRNTAVFVTGYRGSPLGGFDQALHGAEPILSAQGVVFQPGVNEDLAATAVWGTQQAGLFGGARVDGVSGLWYGKGPGVDRTGDVFKHGNLAGSAREGGVLAVAGDDHTCKSSTTAHQSEFALVDAMIPVLVPATLAEILEYGLAGWAMSRFSGAWVGLKVMTELMDSTASLDTAPFSDLVEPPGLSLPAGGLNIRWPDTPLAQEERLHRHKIPAVLAFARANRLDRLVLDAPQARFGIATVGKSYLDVRQALADLGIDEARAARLGIRLYKVALAWPLEPEGARAFADGLEEILVVEEKRGLVEDQLRQHLYGRAGAPRIHGKRDLDGAWQFPSNGDLNAALIARVIAGRLAALTGDAALRARLPQLACAAEGANRLERIATRSPHFCSGCPHNTSTRVPEGSRAFAGIGCHYLVLPMERQTEGFTHMGGEGANWIGLAPFSTTEHVFQNIGDGTYFHSGSMAIRAAVASGANMTYKILFNHAVAMTGGQPVEGELTVAAVTRQLAAEGVRRVVVVSDDPLRYGAGGLDSNVAVHDRKQLDAVQRELREVPGVTAIVYDQTCATEQRRLRKRGKLADPQVAVVINDLVCEGCGDCSKASNCLSVTPVDTEFGRKRAVDLSTCNKDQSCLDGFCPSFVTVHGGRPRKPAPVMPAPMMVEAEGALATDLPDPVPPTLDRPFAIVVTGIGGTGVVTIGALLGMAAHLEGKAVRVLDMTGLAQKGGAVVSHIQVAKRQVVAKRQGEPQGEGPLHAARIGPAAADLLIGCDPVVAAAPENLGCLAPGGRMIINDHETITGQFTRERDYAVPLAALRRQLRDAVPDGHADWCDATALATALMGDAVGANLFLVGYAYQRGQIPVSAAALDRAIVLNGVAVAFNRAAFAWGRRAAVAAAAVAAAARRPGMVPDHHRPSTTLEEAIDRRTRFLVDYQDEGYAARYGALVRAVAAAERDRVPGATALADAVARSLFKLMACKDEYEVARLHSGTGFLESLAHRFEGDYRLRFHLAPPLLAPRDPATGRPRKRAYGPWVIPAFRMLARLKRLRGTPFDPFGWTAERRQERRLAADYAAAIAALLPDLAPHNHAAAVAVAVLPQSIRGFGHVKEQAMAEAPARQAALLRAFREAKPADAGARLTEYSQ